MKKSKIKKESKKTNMITRILNIKAPLIYKYMKNGGKMPPLRINPIDICDSDKGLITVEKKQNILQYLCYISCIHTSSLFNLLIYFVNNHNES